MVKIKNVFWLSLISVIGSIMGYIFLNSYRLNLCYSNTNINTFDVSCHGFYINIGEPLFYGMSALAIVFLILLFTPRAFPAWKKFAKWFVPIAALILIFYKGPGAMDLFSPYPEQVFRWIGVLYVVISVLIIVFNSSGKKTEAS